MNDLFIKNALGMLLDVRFWLLFAVIQFESHKISVPYCGAYICVIFGFIL
jgi:hypothetical protein